MANRGEPRRRRRTPEAAQQEIVAAAEALLRERPFRELTVDEVMRRTGLSRPSFYVYFKDRHALVLRVVGHLQAELLEVANRWFEQLGTGPDVLRDVIAEFVGVYRQHSAVMRALADAASDDPEVEAVYGALIQSFVDVSAERIAQEGAFADADPGETAKALVWMTERYLYHAMGPNGAAPSTVTWETLALIWTRTVYPSVLTEQPAAGGGGAARHGDGPRHGAGRERAGVAQRRQQIDARRRPRWPSSHGLAASPPCAERREHAGADDDVAPAEAHRHDARAEPLALGLADPVAGDERGGGDQGERRRRRGLRRRAGR